MKHTVEYRCNGKTYAMPLPAKTSEEAQQHINAMYFNGVVQEVLTRTGREWFG